MKILFSGFEPFGTNKVNPSQELLEDVSKINVEDVVIQTVLLPVTYRESFPKLLGIMNTFDPDVIISLGLASKRTKINLEKIAKNLIASKQPDNEGIVIEKCEITEGIEENILSNLPIEQIKKRIEAIGIDIETSDDCGSYVCNYVMFQVLSTIDRTQKKAGFIHLPSFDIISKEDQLLSICEVIKALKL
jgi:pyroglutamyl-peptidase